MKNSFKVFGIIVLAATIVFTVIACDNGSGGGDSGDGGGSGSLAGTWLRHNVNVEDGHGPQTLKIVISENEWIFSTEYYNYMKGTFTANASTSTITFTVTHGWNSSNWTGDWEVFTGVDDTLVATYTLNGNNKLTLSGVTGDMAGPLNGVWTR